MHPSSSKTPGRLTLLVDDEALVRLGIALLLKELDHQVLQATSGAHAVRLLLETPGINMLITDYRMTDMDGLTLIDQARLVAPSISAILMTGYPSDDALFDKLDVPHLPKPFGIAELEAALTKAR